MHGSAAVTRDEDDPSDFGLPGTGCCGTDVGGGHVTTNTSKSSATDASRLQAVDVGASRMPTHPVVVAPTGSWSVISGPKVGQPARSTGSKGRPAPFDAWSGVPAAPNQSSVSCCPPAKVGEPRGKPRTRTVRSAVPNEPTAQADSAAWTGSELSICESHLASTSPRCQ
jgi:hypothetical protein